MKKTIKKLVSALLVFVMLLSVAPLGGLNLTTKSSALEASGQCGDNVYWTFDESTGLLTISGTGKMKNYVFNSSPFYYKTSIKNIIIEDGITNVGSYAFYMCTGLISIYVDENNQYYSSDEYGVLFNKDKTDLIQYPVGNSRKTYTIPNGVKSIYVSAFEEGEYLTNITIPNSVASIDSEAFKYCTKLKCISVDENNQYYSNDEYGVLFNKGKTELIQYPIGNSRTSYTVPNSVLSIGCDAFEYCTSLTSVTIPDSVTSIGACAFYYCNGLTNVTIGNNITSIGDYAFVHCRNLTSVTIPDSVTSIGAGAFRDCSGLTSITIGNGVTSIGRNTFGKTGYYVDDNNWEDNVLYIGNYLIEAKDDLSGWYKIKDGTRVIGSDAFGKCTALTSVTIPDSVISIGRYAFDGCSALSCVTIGKNVTNIGYRAFEYCTSLTSIAIPDSVTEIGECAFECCTGLTNFSVDVNNQYYSSDEYGALFNKNKTKLIQYAIGNNRTTYTIPDSVTSIDDYAFEKCSSLTSITIPDNVINVGYCAFYNCVGLINVIIGNGVINIGRLAFAGCESLISATVGNSVTNIDNSSFEYCYGLTNIIIGNSVTNIGLFAFDCCTNLKDVYYWGSKEEWEKITIGKGNDCLNNATIHYNYTPIHTHSYASVVTPPDCTHKGFTTYICTCGDTYVTDYVNALGHNYGEWQVTTPATCTTKGVETRYCSRCTAKETREIPTKTHNYESVVTNPTCTTKGFTTYTCKDCKNSYVDSYVNALGHDFGEWKVTTPATCTTKGVETRYCSRCEAKETRDIEKLDHTYTSVVTKPTCTTRGFTTYTCTCGDTYTDNYVDALGHNFGEWKVTTPATCTTKGVETRYCSRCTAAETREIEKTAHKYTSVVTPPDCTHKGFTTYTCTCGDTYVADYVDAKGHTDGEWKVTKPATYTETGIRTLYCKDCGAELRTEIIPVITGKVLSVSINDIEVNYKNSATIKPEIKTEGNAKYTVKYETSNSKIATVDDNGNITTYGKGTATITCTVTDEGGNVVKDTCTVNVKFSFGQWLIWILLLGFLWY